MLVLKDAGYYISKNFHKEEVTPKRRVKWYEIELYKTDLGISVINGEEYRHQKGNVLVAKPQDIRYSKKSFECHSVKFANADRGIIRYLEEIHGVMHIMNESRVEKIYREIYRAAADRRAGAELFTDAKIRELIYEIYNEKNTYNTAHEFSDYAENIYAAAAFISENYALGISLNSMASAADLSPAFFHRVFKTIMGETPWEYLNRTRLNNARLYLENTPYSIEVISQKCGFSSRQYFDTAFKKGVGVTPALFRKSIHRTI